MTTELSIHVLFYPALVLFEQSNYTD
jgi:hypothetical protein